MDGLYPEDRVLVGVINRTRDFEIARDQHWYRIPVNRAPRFFETEYLAFYFSRSFKNLNGGIHYFARRTGHELVRRRDLLPEEKKRADDLYYKLSLSPLVQKSPPILNPTARPISFVFTTWDRFANAEKIADLYSKSDWFVERVSHVLKNLGIQSEQRWEYEDRARPIAELRVRCEKGLIAAMRVVNANVNIESLPKNADRMIYLPEGETEEDLAESVAAIQSAIDELGGPVFVDIPLEG